MTIDEILNKLQEAVDGEEWLDFWQAEEIEYGKQLIKALEELRWYRSQDLISRPTLLANMDGRYKEKVKIVPDNLAEGFMQMEKLIKQIPKAEYGGDENGN